MGRLILLITFSVLSFTSHGTEQTSIKSCAWTWHSNFSRTQVNVSYELENGKVSNGFFCQVSSEVTESIGAGGVWIDSWEITCTGGQTGYLSKVRSGLTKFLWHWQVSLKPYPNSAYTNCIKQKRMY